MTKKKSGHTFPICPLCDEEYEAYGIAGKSKHWKARHPDEWAEYKEKVTLPSLKKAMKARMKEAAKRKRKPRKQALEEAVPRSSNPKEEEHEAPDNPAPIQKPSVGTMPQQIFSVVLPPDTTEDEDVEIMEALLPQSDVKTGSATLKPIRTDRFAEANVFAYVPKVFSFSSVLLHAAWQVTVQAWGWDPDEPMGKWLDRYLFMTMERLGIRLMAYQVIEPVGGNGHDNPQQIGVPVLHARDEGSAPVEPWPR